MSMMDDHSFPPMPEGQSPYPYSAEIPAEPDTQTAPDRDAPPPFLEPEKIPEGLTEPEEGETAPDLYSLLSALTSLRQEIALQGRSFHQLEQTLHSCLKESPTEAPILSSVTSLHDEIRRLQEDFDMYTARRRAKERKRAVEEGFQTAVNVLLEPLLDTHDQFRRMEEQNRRRPARHPSWFSFRKAETGDDGFDQTVHLILVKLEQRLEALGVVSVAREGMSFDPQTMKAVDLERSDAYEPHTVVEVYHQGYQYRDRIVRFAEVKVASS